MMYEADLYTDIAKQAYVQRMERDFERQLTLVERTFLSPAQKRNFDFHISTTDERSWFVQNSCRAEFDQYVPKDVVLTLSAQCRYDKENKRVLFDGTMIHSRGAVLILLHEIRHAQWFSETPDLMKVNLEMVLDCYFYFMDHLIHEELDAWRGAIDMGKDLEKKGFNVISEFPEDELIDAIHAAIMTYVYDHLASGVSTGKLSMDDCSQYRTKIEKMGLRSVLASYLRKE